MFADRKRCGGVLALTALVPAVLMSTAAPARADDEEKSFAMVYLNGKAGSPVPMVFTDLKFGDIGAGLKFKYDFNDRKNPGKVKTFIINIFEGKFGDPAPKGIYAITCPTGDKVFDPGSEYDFEKLPEGWKALDLKSFGMKEGLPKLPAGSYLMTVVIVAENGTGTVRVEFQVK